MGEPFQNKASPSFVEVSGWSYRSNPAVREMLDHVAEELAEEYMLLMETSHERKEKYK